MRTISARRWWSGVVLGALLAVGAWGAAAPPEVVERVEILRAEVARHDDLYFRRATPEISDHAYDRLKFELRRLEAMHPEIPDTRAVVPAALGDDRSGTAPTQRHGVRMGGLDKAFNEGELRAWVARVAAALGREDVEFVVEPKFDGAAISVTYEGGRLVRAATRGDGETGDEVTAQVRAVPGMPEELAPPFPARIEVRGEFYVPWPAFHRLNEEREAAGEAGWANPRNLAAGTLKQADPAVVAGRGAAVVFFGWGAVEPAAAQPSGAREFYRQLGGWGLPVLRELDIARGGEALWAVVEAWGERRRALPYATDGVVVKVVARAERERLGEGAHAPRWAVAFKFPPDQATTRVRAITWQVGRSGVLTPVAELEPVTLAGSVVTRATLHNAARVAASDWRVGDWVTVEKVGEIIPAVGVPDRARRAATSAAYALPEHCPSCATAVTRAAGKVDLECGNRSCPARVVRRLEHFAARAAMDIRGLGPATLTAAVAHGAVAGPVDLYGLNEAGWRAVPGVGERGAAQLAAAVASSRGQALARVLAGLGAPGVGLAGARVLADYFGDAATLLAASAAGDDWPVEVARAWRRWAAEPGQREELAALVAAGVGGGGGAAAATEGEGALAGEVVVFTGVLSRWSRAEAARLVEAAGGEVASGLSRRVTLVVVGERPGARAEEARARGLTVVDEAAFRGRLER